MKNKKIILILVTVAAALFAIFVFGLFWLTGARQQIAESSSESFVFMMLFSFASGLSMLVLTCALPLIFIIVPVVASKGYRNGFLMTLFFGLGFAMMLGLYGFAMAHFKHILGIKGETPVILLIIGLVTYFWGLSELGIINISSFLPISVQKQENYLKSFLFGLLVGNAGIGCPNPHYYMLTLYITVSQNVNGFLLGAAYGLGRILPVIFTSILALFAYQATSNLVANRFSLKSAMKWIVIIIGSFLISSGIFHLRSWWILATPPFWTAFLVTGICIIIAVIAKTIFQTKRLST